MNYEGIQKPLLKELHFSIGEQYELNEFNLKSLDSTFSNGLEYENYEYIKDDFKTFLGLKLIQPIILQYNGDILSGIIYSLKLKNTEALLEELNIYLPFSKKLTMDKFTLGQTINVFSFQGISLMLDIKKNITIRVFVKE